jgi:hypothetical protein
MHEKIFIKKEERNKKREERKRKPKVIHSNTYKYQPDKKV